MSHENNGQCLYCGATNPYTALTCRRCQTRLPWADAMLQQRTSNVALAAYAEPDDRPIAPYVAGQPPIVAGQSQMQAGQANFCAHCGTRHTPGASYCAHCGTPVGVVAQAVMPSYAPHMMAHPGVNVSVVTNQNTDSSIKHRHRGPGVLARFALFCFKTFLLGAFLLSMIAALSARHEQGFFLMIAFFTFVLGAGLIFSTREVES